MALERLFPNEAYHKDWAWTLRLGGLACLGIPLTLALGTLLEQPLSTVHPVPEISSPAGAASSQLSPCVQGLLGYYCATFFVYWWHRLRHYSNPVWRVFHQIHHSTYRLQALTAFYAHPSDFLSNALIVNTVAYVLLGYSVDAAIWTTFWVSVFELWEHTNIRTPHWLGYLVVRPEMHRIHHERGRHANNYAIPLWDLLFGTYENTMRSVQCGFRAENERAIFSMLRFKRVE